MKNFISNKNLLGVAAKRVLTENNMTYKRIYMGITWACITHHYYSDVIWYLKDVIKNTYNTEDIIDAAKEILEEFEGLIKND